MDGKNLLPFLRRETVDPPHEVLYWGRRDRYADRSDEWKLVREQQAEDAPAKLHLFNFQNDVADQHDVAQQHQEIVQQLLKSRQQWQDRLR